MQSGKLINGTYGNYMTYPIQINARNNEFNLNINYVDLFLPQYISVELNDKFTINDFCSYKLCSNKSCILKVPFNLLKLLDDKWATIHKNKIIIDLMFNKFFNIPDDENIDNQMFYWLHRSLYCDLTLKINTKNNIKLEKLLLYGKYTELYDELRRYKQNINRDICVIYPIAKCFRNIDNKTDEDFICIDDDYKTFYSDGSLCNAIRINGIFINILDYEKYLTNIHLKITNKSLNYIYEIDFNECSIKLYCKKINNHTLYVPILSNNYFETANNIKYYTGSSEYNMTIQCRNDFDESNPIEMYFMNAYIARHYYLGYMHVYSLNA